MLSLKAKIRTDIGRRNKKLRKDGYIPGVLYGRKVSSTPVAIGYKEFSGVYSEAGESALVSLEIDQDDSNRKGIPKENTVLIRDAVKHPLTNAFIHVDFYQVPMDEKITVAIPLAFENEAPAAKIEGAVLVRNIYEIEVSALPKDLPSEIRVDLSKLIHTGDEIHVSSLVVRGEVDIKLDDSFVIASASAPIEEEIVEEPKAEVAPSDIKTELEEKREEAAKEAAEEAALKSESGQAAG